MPLVGDWKKVFAWLMPDSKEKQLEEAAKALLKEIGEHGSKRIQQRIASGQVGGPALSPVTKTQKRQRGLDARKLIATGAYMRSIRYTFEGQKRIHIRASKRYQKLSNWLEFGTNKMPARPHIRPAYDELLKFAEMAAKKYGFKIKGF